MASVRRSHQRFEVRAFRHHPSAISAVARCNGNFRRRSCHVCEGRGRLGRQTAARNGAIRLRRYLYGSGYSARWNSPEHGARHLRVQDEPARWRPHPSSGGQARLEPVIPCTGSDTEVSLLRQRGRPRPCERLCYRPGERAAEPSQQGARRRAGHHSSERAPVGRYLLAANYSSGNFPVFSDSVGREHRPQNRLTSRARQRYRPQSRAPGGTTRAPDPHRPRREARLRRRSGRRQGECLGSWTSSPAC